MKNEELKKKIISVILESTETDMEISDETDLFWDMGLSSVEVMVLLGDLEDTFGIDIPMEQLRSITTVGELSEIVIAVLTEETENFG